MRLIDQDILTWTAIAESDQERLRRCHPDEEAYHQDLVVRSRAVLVSLEEYRKVLDKDHG